MPSKIYWVYHFANTAKLGIMARPRGADWLDDEIKSIKREAGLLVSLLEVDEVYELGLQDEEATCNSHGIEFINFPIPDRGIPCKESDVKELINYIGSKLLNKASVIVHCRMGIGRSSLIAGAVLLKEGLRVEEIIALISNARGLNVPDTQEQIDWLKRHS